MHIGPTAITVLTLLAALIAPSGAAEENFPPVGSTIPPVKRVETYLDAGAFTVEALPAGTTIHIERASGVAFTLESRDNRFNVVLPEARLDEDGNVLVTPLGFKIGSHAEFPETLYIEAPNGRSTLFRRQGRRLLVYESDGGRWDTGRDRISLRLQDGTRIDRLDNANTWEILTLGGERYRILVGPDEWTVLPTIPSPPLIPDVSALFVAGDGDDWRYPAGEDHVVFGWNWFPYGMTAQQILDPLRIGQRSLDIIETFKGFVVMPQPEELAGYLIGRRLALSGGDRVTIEAPGRDAVTAYLLPGHFDPDFILPRIQNPGAFRRPTAPTSNR